MHFVPLRKAAVAMAAITALYLAGGCTTDSDTPTTPTTSSSAASVAPSTTAPSAASALPRWTANSDYKVYSESMVAYLAGLAAELGKPIDPKKLAIESYAAGKEPKEIDCGDDVSINLESSLPHIVFCKGKMVVLARGFQMIGDENQIVSSFTWAIADAMGGNSDEARTRCFMGALSRIYAAGKGTALDVAATHMNLSYEGDAGYTKGRQSGVNAC